MPEKYPQSYCSNWPRVDDNGYCLQADIRNFFASINHQILFDLICKKTQNKEILWLAKRIIFHDCARDIKPKIQSPQTLFDKLPPEKSLFTVSHGKGLPIGNLTSQFFANVYMNEFDQFVKHKLKAKYYIRYVDDFIILSRDKEKLKRCREEIAKFLLNNLKLKLHPKKQKIGLIKTGIDFLGYFVKPDCVLVRRRVVGEMKFRMKKLMDKPEEERKTCLASYMAHLKWANSFGLRKSLAKQM